MSKRKTRTQADWERLAMNIFCPYCLTTPGRECVASTPTSVSRRDKPHKTRVTAVKKGAAP